MLGLPAADPLFDRVHAVETQVIGPAFEQLYDDRSTAGLAERR